jgi:hypothetical protein
VQKESGHATCEGLTVSVEIKQEEYALLEKAADLSDAPWNKYGIPCLQYSSRSGR